MIKNITVDGNEACARTAYMFTEMAGIYPITPSSTMAELVDEWSNKGMLNVFNDTVKVVEMQSEAGAAGFVHGSLTSGCLTTTFTASQGLLLMIPNMYKMAGEMLPAVFHVAARSLATHALSIFGDHQDIYATRQTGFCMLASSSVQDAAILSAVAHLSAIESSMPFMHFFDGFRTSHEINKIKVFEIDDIKKLVNKDALKRFRDKSLNPLKPMIKGTNENPDIYFQMSEVRNKDYNNIPCIVSEYMMKLNDMMGTNYKPFNYYGSKTAKNIIIAMGSVCEAIKETINVLNKNNYNIGLVEVHLYRPFSSKYLKNILPKTVENIAVIDRTKEPGSAGEPLYLDVVSALKDKNINIVGGRYGLSSKNTTPKQIKAIYDMLNTKLKNNFTIGINDDVTNLSLKVDDDFKIISDKTKEFLIYGYGSDGMVSASKSIIKLMGNETNNYVQGYFEYDSKKSGGVTIGHLRFSKELIHSSYFVENPSLIVCTKDAYLKKYDVVSKIRTNGVFILNTRKTKEELFDLYGDVFNELKKKNITFYMINAYDVALKLGLDNKISMIMESIILYVTKIIDYDLAKENMKVFVKKRFFDKGEDIIKANYKAIDESLNYLEKVDIPFNLDDIKEIDEENLYSEIDNRNGDNIPVSSFLKYKDGSFIPGTSKYDKREISDNVPKWIKENCIMCNTCSTFCPHAVIRPYLLNKEEYENAPKYIKDRCLIPYNPDLKDYKFTLGISVKDCTGCGVCIKSCPGIRGDKALTFNDLEDSIKDKEQKIFNYLENEITDKKVDTKTIITTQFHKPKFEFSGACAGCGETPYLKLLTQVFGDYLVVSNATGCSSIYASSMPSMPYSIPWANSLFEDNAEYGYGMLLANKTMKNRIKDLMESDINDEVNSEYYKKWLDNSDNFEITKEVYEKLDYRRVPKQLSDLREYIVKRSIWTVGGDGWAYDIGYGGIDHVLASNENVNILVLDSQVYSNTGGQSSKASPKGSIASFASIGKAQNKKDLARIVMSYPHVYVATISMGANPNQALKALKEAENYHGPSIVIAYSSCIAHGIKGGLINSMEMEKIATQSGYFPIFRYNPDTKEFNLDSKQVDFELYDEFLENQTRYNMLKVVNPKRAKELLKENKANAMERFKYYQELANKKM